MVEAVVLGLSDYALGEYNPRTLAINATSQVIDKCGTLGYLAIPAAMLLYNKGPEWLKQLNNSIDYEAAGDLIDIMGGIADEQTYEKYRGSLATMPFEEFPGKAVSAVSGTLCWLWNKIPTRRSAVQVNNDAQVERTIQRLN